MTNIGLPVILTKSFKLKNCKIIEKKISGFLPRMVIPNNWKAKPLAVRVANPYKLVCRPVVVFEIRLIRSFP